MAKLANAHDHCPGPLEVDASSNTGCAMRASHHGNTVAQARRCLGRGEALEKLLLGAAGGVSGGKLQSRVTLSGSQGVGASSSAAPAALGPIIHILGRRNPKPVQAGHKAGGSLAPATFRLNPPSSCGISIATRASFVAEPLDVQGEDLHWFDKNCHLTGFHKLSSVTGVRPRRMSLATHGSSLGTMTWAEEPQPHSSSQAFAPLGRTLGKRPSSNDCRTAPREGAAASSRPHPVGSSALARHATLPKIIQKGASYSAVPAAVSP